MARTNVRGTQIADGANGVDLTVDVTGTLPAGNGGTGLTTSGLDNTKALMSNGAGGFVMGAVATGTQRTFAFFAG